MKNIFFLSIAFALFQALVADAQISLQNLDLKKQSLRVDEQYFTENKGQWPEEVLFLSQMHGLNVWITKSGMTYEFYQTQIIEESASPAGVKDKVDLKKYNVNGQRVNLEFQANNTLAIAQGNKKLGGYKNYLIGNESASHISDVCLYKEVLIKEVYSGIDMRYYFENGVLRYEYIVRPGANPSQIRFIVLGNDKVYKNEELTVTNNCGTLDFSTLFAYQQQDKKSVGAQYAAFTQSWSLDLGAYDNTQALVVSPLVYSTYIGGSNEDEVHAMTLDGSNNSYLTGWTISTDFDHTAGVFQIVNAGSWDVFVSKFNPQGTALVYSTYIGGSGSDFGLAIALDSEKNCYIAGYTNSTNYDVTPNAFQTVNAGNVDVFVTKLNASGDALIYSTLFGGSDGDYARSVKIDSDGNAYIGGYTYSNDYIITSGALQPNFGGESDVFVTKLNAAGTDLTYSTYIGGDGGEFGQSLEIDASRNAYISGYANFNYIVTPGAYQTIYGGGSDIFVSKLNPYGTALVYSTYIGQSGGDIAEAMAIDASGNIYLTGSNGLGNLLLTPGATQTTYGGGWEDAFFTKLNAAGNGLLYSTYFGGNGDDVAQSIVIDDHNNAYITGRTTSTDLNITTGAFQGQNAGGRDGFLVKFKEDGTLLYSTYFGGSQNDVGVSIALDNENILCVAGITLSPDFEVTENALQSTSGGNWDTFLTKFDTSILATSKSEKEKRFLVFPNPSQGIYKVNFEIAVVDASAEVWDLQGRLVHTQRLFGKKEAIDLSNEPQGIYILKIKDNDFSEVARLIKL